MARVENAPARWLAARWPAFFEELVECRTEDDVERVCGEELDAWRGRSTIKSEQSLKRHITDSKKEIERRATAGELSEELAAWAHKYLNFSPEKWRNEINAPTQQRSQERQEHQQFLFQADIEAIAGKLAFLLESTDPFEIALALMGNVGARPIEALRDMELEQVSAYVVLFYGQAKKGAQEFPAFEKPTLAPAGSVMRGLARLRSLLPTQQMSARQINKYSSKLKEAMNRHFADLIPVPNDKTDLYSYLLRSVYARIATYWYCPNEVTDLAFFSAICGHFELVEGTDEQRRIFADSQHYVRYQILNRKKQLDGQHGIKRNEKGVETLKVFQPKPAETEPQGTKKKEKDHTIARFRPEVERRLKLEATRREIPVTGNGYWANDTVLTMLDDPTGAGGKPTPEQLVGADIALLVRKSLGEDGDFQAFLEVALRKEAKFREGVDNRYKAQDVSSISTTKLSGIRTMDAAYERFRRATAAIMAHNEKASSPNDKWYVNTTTVHNLVGGQFGIITSYLNTRAEEITAHNAKHGLTPLSNRKAAKINEEKAGPARVIVPE